MDCIVQSPQSGALGRYFLFNQSCCYFHERRAKESWNRGNIINIRDGNEFEEEFTLT